MNITHLGRCLETSRRISHVPSRKMDQIYVITETSAPVLSVRQKTVVRWETSGNLEADVKIFPYTNQGRWWMCCTTLIYHSKSGSFSTQLFLVETLVKPTQRLDNSSVRAQSSPFLLFSWLEWGICKSRRHLISSLQRTRSYPIKLVIAVSAWWH